MKKNEEFISKCVSYDNDGNGIVKHNGIVFFVKGLIKGEQAKILCVSMKKTYGFGKVLEIIKPSENRVNPVCSVYKQCGGCQLQHMSHLEQKYFKENKVKTCFESIAKLNIKVNDILSMDNPYRYRNKVSVPVSIKEDLKMGFYRNHSNDIVEFDDCVVQTELSNKIISYIKKELPKYDFKYIVRHVLIKHSHNTNEVMVVLIVKQALVLEMESFIDKLYKEFNQIKSIILNINKREDNVILGDKEYLIKGEVNIQEELCGYNFNISSKSFFQINPYQTEVLYNTAIKLANLSKDEVVLDLYCGIGTIGIIASKYAKKVIGVEVIKEAIDDAKVNAKNNNVENIEFYCGDAGTVATKLINENVSIDVVIVDPPRKGLDKTAIDAILKINPKKLVYVSCDPATLARDVRILVDNGYSTEEVTPVDMFPNTNHVECIALIQRVNS